MAWSGKYSVFDEVVLWHNEYGVKTPFKGLVQHVVGLRNIGDLAPSFERAQSPVCGGFGFREILDKKTSGLSHSLVPGLSSRAWGAGEASGDFREIQPPTTLNRDNPGTQELGP